MTFAVLSRQAQVARLRALGRAALAAFRAGWRARAREDLDALAAAVS